RKKRLRRWIVNDTAIACKETARRRRDDLPGRVDPVLQWHKQPPFPASRAPCYRSAHIFDTTRKPEASMHVLVVQNFEGASLGQVAIALDEANATVETIRADKGEKLPDAANGYDALVVLGGGQNALADDVCPWLPGLCDLMRDFSDSDRSVLGICLGGQLLARAYGAQNIVGGATEFGWREVE